MRKSGEWEEGFGTDQIWHSVELSETDPSERAGDLVLVWIFLRCCLLVSCIFFRSPAHPPKRLWHPHGVCSFAWFIYWHISMLFPANSFFFLPFSLLKLNLYKSFFYCAQGLVVFFRWPKAKKPQCPSTRFFSTLGLCFRSLTCSSIKIIETVLICE